MQSTDAAVLFFKRCALQLCCIDDDGDAVVHFVSAADSNLCTKISYGAPRVACACCCAFRSVLCCTARAHARTTFTFCVRVPACAQALMNYFPNAPAYILAHTLEMSWVNRTFEIYYHGLGGGELRLCVLRMRVSRIINIMACGDREPAACV